MVLHQQQLRFSGALLKRGFWLYLWKIQKGKRSLFYVGRTGDNSSHYASSPFNRFGMHLDLRKTATANCIVRLLREEQVHPEQCHFEMFALGPLYKEQLTFDAHKPYRNTIALLEAELADYLRKKGLVVLGKHPKRGKYNARQFSKIKELVDKYLLKTQLTLRPTRTR